VLKHPRRDPGCFNEAPALLQTYQTRAHRALVVLDREGSGQEDKTIQAIERDIEMRLARSGWAEDRCGALALEPELEILVWSDSSHVDDVLGWKGRTPSLRDWLRQRGFLQPGEAKPRRPKEALEAALRFVQEKRSPALYGRLAQVVGLSQCQDAGFLRLRRLLAAWFPAVP
jgi:hypothetical protein